MLPKIEGWRPIIITLADTPAPKNQKSIFNPDGSVPHPDLPLYQSLSVQAAQSTFSPRLKRLERLKSTSHRPGESAGRSKGHLAYTLHVSMLGRFRAPLTVVYASSCNPKDGIIP